MYCTLTKNTAVVLIVAKFGQLNSTGGVDIRARPWLLEHRTYNHVDARKFNHQERMARMAMKEVDERGRPCDLSDGEQLYCSTAPLAARP